MPLLNDIDKLWLSFQLVCAVVQIHEEDFYHGDIKPDNVLLTSWGWLFLTDFAPYKPAYLPSEKWGDYQFFFAGESTKVIACYVAPEKFVSVGTSSNTATLQALQTMDIFSLGCVLAEIYLDGNTLFDLPKLQEYKQGLYKPITLLQSIENEAIKEIITSMISINPQERKTAKEYLEIMIKKIVPPSFVQFIYYFLGCLVYPDLTSSDRKIAVVYSHLNAIWKSCFNCNPPVIVQSLNSIVFESVREIPFAQLVAGILPKGFPYCVRYDNSDKEIVSSTTEGTISGAMKSLLSVIQ